MPEPASFWGVFKSFFGIFGSIAKEVIKRYNQPKLVAKATYVSRKRNKHPGSEQPSNLHLPLVYNSMMPDEEDMSEQTRWLKKMQEEKKKYEATLLISRDYLLEWKYDIILTNNSDHTAYKIKVVSTDKLSVIDEIDYTKPIPANQSVSFSVIIRESILATKPETENRLKEGGDFKLHAEYSNVKGTRYFTVFKSEMPIEEQNQFGRVK